MDGSLLSHKFAYEPLDGNKRIGVFHTITLTAGYTTCSVNDTPNLERYVASFEAVPPPSKTSYGGKCEWGHYGSKQTKYLVNAR